MLQDVNESNKNGGFVLKHTMFCFFIFKWCLHLENFQCLELNSAFYCFTNIDTGDFETVEASKLEIICFEFMS